MKNEKKKNRGNTVWLIRATITIDSLLIDSHVANSHSNRVLHIFLKPCYSSYELSQRAFQDELQKAPSLCNISKEYEKTEKETEIEKSKINILTTVGVSNKQLPELPRDP